MSEEKLAPEIETEVAAEPQVEAPVERERMPKVESRLATWTGRVRVEVVPRRRSGCRGGRCHGVPNSSDAVHSHDWIILRPTPRPGIVRHRSNVLQGP